VTSGYRALAISITALLIFTAVSSAASETNRLRQQCIDDCRIETTTCITRCKTEGCLNACSEEEALRASGPDTVYYATRLRGASNEKARRELGFRPRPLEWI
jgi:hypothetical protein